MNDIPAETTSQRELAAAPKLLWRAAECAVLFVLVPALYVLDALPFPMIPLLVLVALVCLLMLLRDPTFDRKQLGWGQVRRAHLSPVFAWFIVGAIGIVVFTWLWTPERLFELPRRNVLLWAMIMVFYPLLSVYPQEILYRTFFFHRYSDLFPRPRVRIAASAAAFGYMHIVFENWIAVVLTLLGGLLFAKTYESTRSTLAVSFEHALYGCLIFTIGLGWYFYGGAVR